LPVSDDLRRELAAAHQEARQVGDSPVRADRLADRLVRLAGQVQAAEVTDELRARLQAALDDAERVLRRDDDGFEAARHLQAAMRLAEDRPRAPSPFSD
jgi:23S rRNA A2030 N6-methylase RlmJ